MNVSLLFQWNDTTLPSSSFHNNRYNEIWGFAINGREYAVIGSTMGTHIFDVTVPNSIDAVAFIPGAAQGTGIVHRDYKSYQNYLYMVCDEGASTLQIADIGYLPDSAPLVYNSAALFQRSHNIYIDTATAKMYVCGGSNQLEVYSLADPENPVRQLRCPTDIFWWSTVGNVHDAYSRNDTVYCNAENRGLFIVDFSNIANPQLIGSLTSYPQQGYNHSGWLNETGTIYALADETFGMDIKILNVSDLSNITVLDTIGSDVHPLSMPHNLIIKDNFLFVSYYKDGLYIFNISDPANPFVSGYYDTSTEPHVPSNYRGAWGVNPLLPSGIVLISDMQNGLFVFDVSDAVIQSVKEKREGYSTISIFPNPFSENITVSLPNNKENTTLPSPVFRRGAGGEVKDARLTLELFDVLGRKVLSEKQFPANSNKYIIKTDDLPGGIYILEVKSENIIHHQKIIKQQLTIEQ